jgi:phosphatidylglycerol---prolipoprotein diacylglyceryl transferase
MCVTFLALPFPPLDPVAFSVGPFSVRWYGLAYFFGLLLTWRYCLSLCALFPKVSRKQVDDFLVWGLIGVVVGGRLGHVLFYELHHYLQNPLEIFQTWKGGMSFHGGLLGVSVAFWLYTRLHQISLLSFSDLIACGVPLGLFLGRLANFVNGELYGRMTDVPWAVCFPSGGYVPRHPSQLYEAFLEGALLWGLLWVVVRISVLRGEKGILTGLFLMGYGGARIVSECFREPESLWEVGGMVLTYGQVLSIPVVVVGLFFILLPLLKLRRWLA